MNTHYNDPISYLTKADAMIDRTFFRCPLCNKDHDGEGFTISGYKDVCFDCLQAQIEYDIEYDGKAEFMGMTIEPDYHGTAQWWKHKKFGFMTKDHSGDPDERCESGEANTIKEIIEEILNLE